MYLLAYRNHLSITSTCLQNYQRSDYINLPTATTLQQNPLVYHTIRGTTILTCLMQPPYNCIHLSAILSETRLYLPAYSNHLTITSTCLPYYQRHNYTVLSCQKQPAYNNTHLSTILSEAQLYFPVNSNHLTITPTCLPYYQRYDCSYLPTATTFINLASLPFKKKFYLC